MARGSVWGQGAPLVIGAHVQSCDQCWGKERDSGHGLCEQRGGEGSSVGTVRKGFLERGRGAGEGCGMSHRVAPRSRHLRPSGRCSSYPDWVLEEQILTSHSCGGHKSKATVPADSVPGEAPSRSIDRRSAELIPGPSGVIRTVSLRLASHEGAAWMACSPGSRPLERDRGRRGRSRRGVCLLADTGTSSSPDAAVR